MDEDLDLSEQGDDAEVALTPEELFEKNLETFRELVPQAFERIKNHKPISKLMYLDNGEPALEFGDKVIYEKGAVTEAKEQIEKYSKYASRLTIEGFAEEGLDPQAQLAFKNMRERFGTAGFRISSLLTRDESYFLIVVGVGLAQHLDALAERTKCRVMVLVEPNVDLIHQSWYVYDWRPLIESMNERGGIEFEIGATVSNTVANLHTLFRHYNPIGFDGTTVFRHYQTSITSEIEREFKENVGTALMGLGFYQDEVNMVGQTYKNLEHGKTRLVQRQTDQPGIPCMIIGNGPSLDQLLPTIRDNAENAIIFACGSAITILVENDIKPDFWIMTERVKDVLTMVDETSEIFDLKQVTFIGSSTVYPGVTDYFDDYILFLRPGLSTAPLFKTRADQIVTIPDPLAANSGLSVALHLGFREFYFMGVDAGSRFKDRGHAKGGYYEGRDDHIKDLPLPSPANFGGTVWTTSVLQWSRENIEKLSSMSPGRTFYNLSDGARIKGVTPLHHKAAKFNPSKTPKAEIVEKLTTNCSVYTLEEFEEKWDDAAIIDRMPKFCDELIAAVVDDDMTDFKFSRDLSDLLEPPMSQSCLAMFLRGTIFGFVIAFEFLNNRFIDPDERLAAQKIFKEEFETMMNSLSDRAVEIFLGLEDGEPWEDFIA
ncbi:DUF115 domain-containing protein [Rhodospirillales bacterium]|nr:DUF115 domain-containing protein [Rhodospirillales bacterium]